VAAEAVVSAVSAAAVLAAAAPVEAGRCAKRGM
jgi:hypothetical protein